MKYGKRDKNHNEIKRLFKEWGCSVFDTADVGQGFPDLVVGHHNHTILVEVKSTKGKLTNTQEVFMSKWQGNCVTARTAKDVAEIVLTHLTP